MTKKTRTKLDVDAETSLRMAGIRQRATAPELAVRAVAARLGLHYRLNNRSLPGSPDLANRTRKWAVFVHGCFWHRHEGCARTTTPTRNRSFWSAKFEANVARDARAVADLRARGFTVVTIWECQTRERANVESALAVITPSPPANSNSVSCRTLSSKRRPAVMRRHG